MFPHFMPLCNIYGAAGVLEVLTHSTFDIQLFKSNCDHGNDTEQKNQSHNFCHHIREAKRNE